MKKKMNRIKALLTLLIMAVTVNVAVAQEAEEPIIVIHSTAWQEVGEGNKFSLFLGTFSTDYYDIDMGSGLNEYEIEPGSLNSETGEWEGTWVPARATEEGIIKIYGNAENLDILCLDGAYVKSIEFSKCVNLEVISLQHNVLENLDLTPFNNLVALYLTDNPFTGDTSLVIGKNKPYLSILEIDIVDKMGEGFNLSDYPSMRVFDAYHNMDIDAIDPTGCPNLLSMSLEMTNVASLDLSKNPMLYSLNISETRITEIDLSRQTNLQLFLASHDSGWVNTGYRLKSIDLRNNPMLFYLTLSGNYLGNVDISNNTLLTNLNLNRNNLSEIDLTNNTELYSVSLMYNNLDFATLPEPQETWGEYFYIQNQLGVPRSIAKGDVIDLSSRVLREGSTTEGVAYAYPVAGEPYQLDSSYYTYADGKVTFLEIPTDSVSIQYVNDVFNEYPLSTTKFKVKKASEVGQPSLKATLLAASPQDGKVKLSVGMGGATATTPQTFYVKYSTGDFMPYTTNFSDEPTGCNVDLTVTDAFDGYIYIYVPEGGALTSLSADNQTLYSVDVSQAAEMRYLSLNGCSLYDINLEYNRCLNTIDVSNNNLTKLNLMGVYGNYAKTTLRTVKASHNSIAKYSNFNTADTQSIRYLDLSYNKFADFLLTDFNNLQYVDLSHNNLSENLYVTYQIESTYVDLSYNRLPSVVIDYFENIDYFNLSNNNMSLETLPLPSDVNAVGSYIYAPQNDYELSMVAPAVNLTAQNRVVDGVGTTFDWRKADGTQLVQGVDVDCVEGATKFLKFDLGEIYCEMTNPAFPQFTGENVYKTTKVTPVEAPTEVVASFTTTKDGTGTVTFTGTRRTDLYIDWRGDGTEYMVYPVETSYIAYPDQVTYAGAEVKVYTYETADLITVFSINGIAMSEGDFSALKNLICFNISGSGLSETTAKLPLESPITELILSDCGFTTFPYGANYPKLDYLVLSNNKLTEFDFSSVPNIGNLFVDGNQLTSVSFNNPRLWSLGLHNNELETVDLNGLPDLYQLFLNGNKLSSLDLSPVSATLGAITLTSNQFTFATLPLASQCPRLGVYYYGNQAMLEAECVNGVVDLSSAAVAQDGTESVYTWYLGEAVYDEDNQVWTGETLVENDEYTIVNGVTTFHYTFDEPVMCLITNATFPNLTMKSKMITIDSAGVENVVVDGKADALVNVYSLSGVLLKERVTPAEVVEGLSPGVYIVGDRKVMIK